MTKTKLAEIWMKLGGDVPQIMLTFLLKFGRKISIRTRVTKLLLEIKTCLRRRLLIIKR